MIVESEEMKAEWFDKDKIPFESMWADCKLWFPYFLKGSYYTADLMFQGYEVITSANVREIS